jgi:signal transduction histidine kinase
MNPVIATEIIIRLFLWVFVFSFEEVTIEWGRIVDPSREYYFIFVFLVDAISLALAALFADDSVVWDIRELILYDMIAQVIGLGMYKAGFSYDIYIILATSIFWLKFCRLIWPTRNADGSALLIWPIFGPLGYWRAKKRSQKRIPYLNNRDFHVYLFIIAIIVVTGFMHVIKVHSKIVYIAYAMIVLIAFSFNRFISYLNDQNARNLATAEALAVQKATAEAHAALIAASEQREQMLVELAAKNEELHSANLQREAMLQDLSKRNEILRDASHDLAQPLMGISYYARQLTEAQGEEGKEEFGEKLLTAVAGLGNLIDDTIHNAKITTQLETPKLEPVSVEHLADRLWAQFLNVAHRKGIGFNLYKGSLMLPIDPQRPERGERSALDFVIMTDEDVLWRIMANLVINAINHTEQGRVLVAFRRRRDVCWIEVRDSGSGIENASGPDREANFLHFAESIKRRYGTFKKGGGHGLGINNVKQLCNTIGTNMTLYSRPGHGSAFRFVVPMAAQGVSKIPDSLITSDLF